MCVVIRSHWKYYCYWNLLGVLVVMVNRLLEILVALLALFMLLIVIGGVIAIANNLRQYFFLLEVSKTILVIAMGIYWKHY